MQEDLKELKHDVKELVKQGIIHNELLRTHEARSLALQEEMKLQAGALVPIKRHVDLMNIFLKAGGTVTVFLAGHALLKLFL